MDYSFDDIKNSMTYVLQKFNICDIDDIPESLIAYCMIHNDVIPIVKYVRCGYFTTPETTRTWIRKDFTKETDIALKDMAKNRKSQTTVKDNVMDNTGILSPWVIYVKKLQAFFDKDPDVTVTYDESEPYIVHVLVNDMVKYVGLSQLIPTTKRFGNIVLIISVVPSNELNYTQRDLVYMAFDNSPTVASIETIQPEGTSNPFTYVSFVDDVVKYHSDTLGDPHGNSFILYQDLANEIFDGVDLGGIYFTTSSK